MGVLPRSPSVCYPLLLAPHRIYILGSQQLRSYFSPLVISVCFRLGRVCSGPPPVRLVFLFRCRDIGRPFRPCSHDRYAYQGKPRCIRVRQASLVPVFRTFSLVARPFPTPVGNPRHLCNCVRCGNLRCCRPLGIFLPGTIRF